MLCVSSILIKHVVCILAAVITKDIPYYLELISKIHCLGMFLLVHKSQIFKTASEPICSHN